MNYALRALARVFPALGLIRNRLRFPNLKVGLNVTVEGVSDFRYGSGVSLGEGSRVENFTGRIVIGDNVSFSRNVHIVSLDECIVRIGADTVVQDNCRIYGDVQIGRRCIFAPNIFVSSGTHTFDAIAEYPIQFQERMSPPEQLPVRIGDDCWFGINAVIGRGVTVGRGCVVGANAVVTRDIAPYTVVGGNPARLLRRRLSFDPVVRIDAREDSDIPYFYAGFEFSVQPRSYFYAPDGYFVLSMAANYSVVKLRMSGDGEIQFGAQKATLSSEPGIVEFTISNEDRSNFLSFRSDKPCRIYSAELV